MTKEIALMPSGDEWQQIKDIALMGIKSGLLPKAVDTPEKAAIIALKGRELGLPPMVSFSHINVIQGKPTMSAEIMLAYIYKEYPNAEIIITEKNEKVCAIKAKRPNESEFTLFRWDLERAKRMGLIGKDNWVKQPETMLFWRTITEIKRAKFPEVLMGIDYSQEELQETFEKDAKVIVPDISNTNEDKKPEQEPKSLKPKNHAPQSSEEAKKLNADLEQKRAQQQASEKTTQEEEIQVPDKKHEPSRAKLVEEVIELQKGLEMKSDEFKVIVFEQTNKQNLKDVTNRELEMVIIRLHAIGKERREAGK